MTPGDFSVDWRDGYTYYVTDNADLLKPTFLSEYEHESRHFENVLVDYDDWSDEDYWRHGP